MERSVVRGGAVTLPGWAATGVRRLSRRLSGWAEATLELLYPPSCAICGTPLEVAVAGAAMCQRCARDLVSTAPACARCAAPYRGEADCSSGCPRCRRRRYAFDAAVALGLYQGRMREAVLQMKRGPHEPAAVAFGQLLADAARAALAGRPPVLVAAAPLHWIRRWRRGFHCAETLAEAVARRGGAPLARRLLVCRRKVKKQGMLRPAERFRNVRGAFGLTTGYDIRGAHVLLVDDVMTTGATASEAARVLRRAGAARVTVAVVARGVGFD